MIAIKRLSIFFFLTITCCSLIRGQTISGIILDSSSKAPIPLAHIYSPNAGTISNAEGRFVINHSFKGETLLKISHVAYESLDLIVENDTSLVIYLKLDVTDLKEFVVDGSAIDMAQILFNKMKTASYQDNFGKAFYRQITENADQAIEWVEGFLDVTYNKSRIKEYKLTQARVAAKPALIGQDSLFVPFNGIFYYSFFSLYLNKVKPNNLSIPFSENEFEDYHYFIDKQYMKGADTMFVIAFEPNGEMDSNATPSGFFTFNKTRQIFHQVEMRYDDLRFRSRDPEGNLEIVESKGKVTFNYNLDENNDIEYITWDCPYKFSYKEQIYDASIKTMMYLYERGSKKSRRLTKPDFSESTFKKFYNAKYKPRFWKENPIIKRTQEEEDLISSFETENAFGTYFKRKKNNQ